MSELFPLSNTLGEDGEVAEDERSEYRSRGSRNPPTIDADPAILLLTLARGC